MKADNPGVIATHLSQKCLCLRLHGGPCDGVCALRGAWPDPKEQAEGWICVVCRSVKETLRGIFVSLFENILVNSGNPCFPALENAGFNETGEKLSFGLK